MIATQVDAWDLSQRRIRRGARPGTDPAQRMPSVAETPARGRPGPPGTRGSTRSLDRGSCAVVSATRARKRSPLEFHSFSSVLPLVSAPIERNGPSPSTVITEALLGTGRSRAAGGEKPDSGRREAVYRRGYCVTAAEAWLLRSSQAMHLPQPKAALQAC